ncbi:hypothetical protein IO44_07685 [Gallibacterium anatis str. Avicor]|uniref:phage baseplate protein n=1 Tax=Gallibacterium anatis TaxID=750 RepID=UPI000531390B|nr:hypothetical protein [Gallibacterium anatis]KGQ55033.1 hypothetical protein IO44_07685 [Gallibacterium anatis str. Avicor]
MSIVNLLFSALVGKRTTIGVLELDALLTETTSLSSQITEYPVEDGTVISDHITQESERLSLSGVITGAGTLFNVGLGKYKLISAKETLRELHANRELITIVTGLDVYEDFAIESLEIERNSDDGERLNVTAEFRKINKVTLRTEEMPPEKAAPSVKGKTGKTKAQVGKASVATPSAAQANKSKTILTGKLGVGA